MSTAIRSRVPAIAALAVPLLLSCAPAPAGETRGVDRVLDVLGSVRLFNEVALSPDGRQLVYGSVSTGKRGGVDVDVSSLWLVSARGGSAPLRLTACPGTVCDEHGAAWSPDGRSIVFVTTDAKDQAQVASADAQGRGARILTDAHGPLDTPRFSPDGRRIAFLYAAGAPKLPGPLNPLGRDAGDLETQVFEQRLAVIPAAGGAPELLGPADLNVYEFDWAPDGRRFAVTAAHGSGDDNWWVAELDLIDATTGAVRTLIKPPLQMASPRWSGDGRRIAYIYGLMSDETITGGDVDVIDAGGGPPVDVTPGLAASVHTITWNGSATRLIATEFAAGEEVLASVDVDARTQRELWRAAQMIWANNIMGFTPGDAGISLSRDGRVSAVVRQSYTRAPEVETGPPGHWQPLTHDNDHLDRLTGEVTNIHWKSDGYDVQGMLVAPPHVEPGRRYPLVVEVHGGPAFAAYPIFPTALECFDAAVASRGYYVLKPNPRGSYGQGEAFTQANVRDFGGGDLRDVLSGVDAVLKVAPVDAQRIGIMGWSYGGFATMWALTQTDRFRAAVAGAGLSDWLSYYGTNNIATWMLPYFGKSVYDDREVYERSSPINFIKHVHAPTLLLGGDRDAEVPISQSYEYWNALRRLGVTTRFVVYPDEGHAFFRREDQLDSMARVVDWFDTYLPPEGSP
jgi:dipeptidyl aminopeptidase/acylaminoacyl peptidase